MRSRQHSDLFRYISWFLFANALFYCLLCTDYLLAIFHSGSLFMNVNQDYSSWPGKLFILSWIILLYLTWMFFLAWMPGLILFPLAILRPRKKLIIMMAVILSLCCALILVIDTKVYALFKFHLNFMLLDMIFSRNVMANLGLSSLEIVQSLLLIVALLLAEIFIAWFVWKKIIIPERKLPGFKLFYIWLAFSFLVYYALIYTISLGQNILSQQTPALPLFTAAYSRLLPDKGANELIKRYSENYFSEQEFSNDPFHYPKRALSGCKSPKSKPYNIILIMVDSLRFDGVNKDDMPLLTQFAQQSWRFVNHFSGGNGTQPGLFSLFYSIPGNYWTAAVRQQVPPVWITLLQQYHYDTKVLWSAGMRHPPFYKSIYLGLPDLPLDGIKMADTGQSDQQVTQQAISWLEAENRAAPFFLNLFYDAAHGFCSRQSFPLKHHDVIEPCTRYTLNGTEDREPYYKRYLNALAFLDGQIAAVLQVVRDKGLLDNSIVMITSDHGQEFNDNKTAWWGHSGNFTRYQTQVPLIIHWPGEQAREFDYKTSSYDVLPTLVENLFACQNDRSDYSIGHNLLQKDGREDFILAGGYVNMGIIEQDRISTLRTSGPVDITDTRGHPLLSAKPRLEVIHQALSMMRRYFSHAKESG